MQQNADAIFVKFAENILSPIYQLALGISLAYFLFGVMMFVFSMNNEEARSKGKAHLLYGTLGLFIMFSIGALFNIVQAVAGKLFGL